MTHKPLVHIPAIAALIATIVLPGCTRDFWYGMGYDVLRQHDCRQQAAVPETAGCARSYRQEYDQYKRDKETLSDTDE